MSRKKRDTPTKQRERLPIVTVRAPRCPKCGGTKQSSYKSRDNGDGSRTRYTRCKACGVKFILILE